MYSSYRLIQGDSKGIRLRIRRIHSPTNKANAQLPAKMLCPKTTRLAGTSASLPHCNRAWRIVYVTGLFGLRCLWSTWNGNNKEGHMKWRNLPPGMELQNALAIVTKDTRWHRPHGSHEAPRHCLKYPPAASKVDSSMICRESFKINNWANLFIALEDKKLHGRRDLNPCIVERIFFNHIPRPRSTADNYLNGLVLPQACFQSHKSKQLKLTYRFYCSNDQLILDNITTNYTISAENERGVDTNYGLFMDPLSLKGVRSLW